MSEDKMVQYNQETIKEAMTERNSFIASVKKRPFLICRLCGFWQQIPDTEKDDILDLIGSALSLGYCSLISGKLNLSGDYINMVPDEVYRWSDDYACFLGLGKHE